VKVRTHFDPKEAEMIINALETMDGVKARNHSLVMGSGDDRGIALLRPQHQDS
jgi:hypothetical protein